MHLKWKKNDWILVLIFILAFIIIRSVYYSQLFRFIYDQVTSSIVALDLWKNKDIMLIGPPMSLTINNRQIFFGGISYYIQLMFLMIGRFDPFWATYSFMVFSGLMIVPLYFGTKKLITKNAAIIMCLVYTFLPFYIEGTTQLWNPYSQLALSPILIYLLALLKKKQTFLISFLTGFITGILFQLHYQFLIVLIGLIYYLQFHLKLKWKMTVVGIIGFMFGVGNLILFELRNEFYLTNTLLLFFQKSDRIANHQMADYYIMSVLFFGLLLVLHYSKKWITKSIIIGLTIILIALGINYSYITASERNFPPGWYYKNELQVYDIIKENYKKGITNFNVFTFYDATAYMQKYLLKRDDIKINYEDYYNNQYLYVLYEGTNFMKNSAYEVNTFTPSKVIKSWKMNERYTLYLLERQYKK